MLIKINKKADKDTINKIIGVYEESNYDNVSYFYPDCKDIELGLKKIKESYFKQIVEFLSDPKNAYYVWEENGEWVSALRLLEAPDFYYLEALETNPKFRKKGYGEKLILALEEKLGKNKKVIIKCSVHKRNMPSINIHKKCGFKISADYSLRYSDEDPQPDHDCYEMSYEK